MSSPFYNEEAERSVLALIVTDPGASDIIAQLGAEDFHSDEYSRIFAAAQSLYAAKRPVDLVTVTDAMKTLYGAGEPALTNRLMEILSGGTFSAAWNAKSHVEIIKAAAMRRKLFEILKSSENQLMEGENDAAAVLDATRQALRDVVTTRHAWVSMADVLLDTYDMLERRAKGEEPSMPSGVATLDTIIGGFRRGELTLLGARPAVGKSALGAHIALATAAQGYKVGICSREMTATQYGSRVIARGIDIPGEKLRSGDLDPEDWAQISDSLSLFSTMNVSFMFSTRYVEDLRMEVQKKVDANDLDLLVVDYVQLLQTKRKFDKDYLRVGYVSKALKDMTTDYNIAILALAQVGRSSQGTMPTLSELRGSGDLEQDADNVIFLHKPDDASDRYVHPDDRQYFDAYKNAGYQYVAINVAKQRQGVTRTAVALFDPARMKFSCIDRRE